jgi:hypothetical protein
MGRFHDPRLTLGHVARRESRRKASAARLSRNPRDVAVAHQIAQLKIAGLRASP